MKKYFYFAVRREKLVEIGAGRTRNVQVLVYGTKVFSNAEDCWKEYWSYIVKHPNSLFGVFGYDKELIIDNVTHECKGFKAGE